MKNTVEEVLDSIVWYNGLGETLVRLHDYILAYDEFEYVIMPDFIAEMDDGQLEFIWMILVLLYGDYGTSPRSGWIEKKKEACSFLEKITETHRQYESED